MLARAKEVPLPPSQAAYSDPRTILATEDEGRNILHCAKGQVVFCQGDPAHSVYYILKGRVELTAVSLQGKQAVVGILGPRDFFGEPCLGGYRFRTATAKALTLSSFTRIEKVVMTRLVRQMPSFAEFFTWRLLSRNIRLEEDLIDELLNSSEKRLARALLLLAGIGKEGKLEAVIPRLSQETLAEMIGTSRQRVNFFMSKFRQLGLIEYGDCRAHKLLVHKRLLDVVLNN